VGKRVLSVATLGPLDGRGVPGPLRVAALLAAEANSSGWDVRLWATTTSQRTQGSAHILGVDVQVFPARQLSRRTLGSIVSPALMVRLARSARSYDLVHLHWGRDLVMIPAAILLRLVGVPYVTQTHGMVEPGRGVGRRLIDRLVTSPILRSAKQNFVLQETEESWIETVTRGRARVTVVPNAGSPAVSAAVRSAPGQSLSVLFLAHLRPRKNVLMFVDAARIICEHRADVEFVIVGPDGGDLMRLKAELERDDCGGRLRYHGAVDAESARLMTASADIYCLPAVNEPFPISVLDAWSLGTPVVMTNECHIAGLAIENDTAEVCPPNPAELAQAMERLLRSPERRRVLAENASGLVRGELSPASVTGDVLRAYESCMED